MTKRTRIWMKEQRDEEKNKEMHGRQSQGEKGEGRQSQGEKGDE